MKINIEEERMSNRFTKYHLKNLPFDAVIHKFSKEEQQDLIHDHPFSFHSKVLFGSYIERVYHINPDGSWQTEIIERKVHDSFFVAATHIHEIIDFPDGDCYTLIQPGKWERESRFWNFDNKLAAYRAWNEKEFKPYIN